MRQKPEPCDVDFLFLQNLAPATVSPDVSANGAYLQLPSSTSSLLGLPPSPSILPSFPSCPEVIFAGTVVELRCVMTTQSWDFMMQSMSKISKRTKEGFFKVLWISQGGSYMWETCHHRRGLIMIQWLGERERAPRYVGSN